MMQPHVEILWAEDNANDRMLIEESLVGVQPAPVVTLVPDGVLLLEALQKKRPDLVVLDLKMPRMGGIEALRRMRAHAAWRTLPVIILSSGNRPDEIAQCQALGVLEIVQKPVDFEAFSAAVQRIVASGRAGAVGRQP